jgi:hypothetical protein
MMMCDGTGRFLFELFPDVFPEGRFTETELLLWGMHYRDKAGP